MFLIIAKKKIFNQNYTEKIKIKTSLTAGKHSAKVQRVNEFYYYANNF